MRWLYEWRAWVRAAYEAREQELVKRIVSDLYDFQNSPTWDGKAEHFAQSLIALVRRHNEEGGLR